MIGFYVFENSPNFIEFKITSCDWDNLNIGAALLKVREQRQIVSCYTDMHLDVVRKIPGKIKEPKLGTTAFKAINNKQ